MLCNCDKDILHIHLDSETADYEDETNGKYNFTIKLPVKRQNYKHFVLYVDILDIQTKGLANDSYLLHADLLEYNSYNSRSKGTNTVIASIFANATGTGRTTDFALNYQGTTKPIIINNIPQNINIEIKDIDHNAIDFSNAANFWVLDLRIEAYY
tara:strand:+ start:105 stop:569 length:465 start_codon:yes stop_codon:yes gene_type:complete